MLPLSIMTINFEVLTLLFGTQDSLMCQSVSCHVEATSFTFEALVEALLMYVIWVDKYSP